MATIALSELVQTSGPIQQGINGTSLLLTLIFVLALGVAVGLDVSRWPAPRGLASIGLRIRGAVVVVFGGPVIGMLFTIVLGGVVASVLLPLSSSSLTNGTSLGWVRLIGAIVFWIATGILCGTVGSRVLGYLSQRTISSVAVLGGTLAFGAVFPIASLYYAFPVLASSCLTGGILGGLISVAVARVSRHHLS